MEAPEDGAGGGEPGALSLAELCAQLPQQRDAAGRLRTGHELLRRLQAPGSEEPEPDEATLDRVVDELTAWLPASHSKVALLGLDILSAFVDRLLTRFKPYIPAVLSAFLDRLGDSKDQVREQAQSLILKLIDRAASPMYVWEHLTVGFKHKNHRCREGVCLCLIATLNTYGAQALALSKLVPHLCILFGDSNGQVRDAAILAMVEVYRHVGEKVRVDLSKRGLPPARLQTVLAKLDEVRNSGGLISSFINAPGSTQAGLFSPQLEDPGVNTHMASSKTGRPLRKLISPEARKRVSFSLTQAVAPKGEDPRAVLPESPVLMLQIQPKDLPRAQKPQKTS